MLTRQQAETIASILDIARVKIEEETGSRILINCCIFESNQQEKKITTVMCKHPEIKREELKQALFYTSSDLINVANDKI